MLRYDVSVPEGKSEVLRIERAIALSCALSAKFRNEVNLSKTKIDGLIRHIEALEGHVARVENHSKNLAAQYESSISWKISSPLRWVARISKKKHR